MNTLYHQTKSAANPNSIEKDSEYNLNQQPKCPMRILESSVELAETFVNNEVMKDEISTSIDDENLDLHMEQTMQKNEGLWKCKVCEKMYNNKSSLKTHSESHIEGEMHTCHICNKTTSTKQGL